MRESTVYQSLCRLFGKVPGILWFAFQRGSERLPFDLEVCVDGFFNSGSAIAMSRPGLTYIIPFN